MQILLLTDHSQPIRFALLGLGINLTFVDSRIVLFGVCHGQGPVVGASRMVDSVTVVAGVDDAAHSQDVQVAFADPGDLFISKLDS